MSKGRELVKLVLLLRRACPASALLLALGLLGVVAELPPQGAVLRGERLELLLDCADLAEVLARRLALRKRPPDRLRTASARTRSRETSVKSRR